METFSLAWTVICIAWLIGFSGTIGVYMGKSLFEDYIKFIQWLDERIEGLRKAK